MLKILNSRSACFDWHCFIRTGIKYEIFLHILLFIIWTGIISLTNSWFWPACSKRFQHLAGEGVLTTSKFLLNWITFGMLTLCVPFIVPHRDQIRRFETFQTRDKLEISRSTVETRNLSYCQAHLLAFSMFRGSSYPRQFARVGGEPHTGKWEGMGLAVWRSCQGHCASTRNCHAARSIMHFLPCHFPVLGFFPPPPSGKPQKM